MSPSPDKSKRNYFVDSGLPTAEIFVIDGESNVKARGVGRLSAELPPGIYRVRYRVGDTVADSIEEFPPGENTYFAPMPDLHLSSPVPLLVPTSGLQPESAQNAVEWSRSAAAKAGAGSSIFLFISGSPDDQLSLLGEVTLRTVTGTEVCSMKEAPTKNGCRGFAIEVSPGSYLLRLSAPDLPEVEQTVVASPDWQTQVFIPVVSTAGRRCLDISQSAVLMSPGESGFQPDWIALRWTEAARQALAAGRGNAAPVESLRAGVQDARMLQKSGFDDATLKAMLHAKFLNPMLGIYGAHLMILKADRDVTLLREVTDNLHKLVGDHPDVLTLHFSLNDDRARQLSFPDPPMLRSSWSLVVQNSTRPELVPSGSYASRVGANLWGAGAYLTWKVPDLDVPAESSAPAKVDWGSLVKLAARVAVPAVVNRLNPIERIVLGQVASAASRVLLAKSFASDADREKPLGLFYPAVRWFVSSDMEKQTEKEAVQSLTPDAITAATGIPYSAITEAANSLSMKLEKEVPSGLFARVAKRAKV